MNYNNYIEPDGEVLEPETVYAVNRELSLARKIVEETSSNLFLTGKAGTGKTTFLRRLRDETYKRMVVLAPTGVAAINAGGMTIHSFFLFPFSPYIPGQGFVKKENSFRMNKEKLRMMRCLDLLVIDEISMVRPDILDAIDATLRRARHSDAPFGGVQLLLIGDLRQLSPVKIENEWNILRPYYPSEFFFESHALRRAGFLTIELREIYRQSDPEFISILNAVRDGKYDAGILARLNSRCRPGFNPDDAENYIRLTSLNRNANAINDTKLNRLPSEEVIFDAKIVGNFPESSYPASEHLVLKIGAQVMFIKNDPDPDHRFYNGMIGTVVDIDEQTVFVAPSDGSAVIATEPLTWENNVYVINEQTKEIKEETAGTFTQIPLRPAWAITIHKSQGLTFSRAIIDTTAAFAPGQTYVALSRCKSLDGLVLEAPVRPSAIIVDGNVNRFIADEKRKAPSEETLLELSRRYVGETACELFSFEAVRRDFEDYLRLESEFLSNFVPYYHDALTAAGKILREEVYPVGLRFANLYRNAFSSKQPDDPCKHLLDKIKGGCAYFREKIAPLYDIISTEIPDLGNKVSNKRLSASLERLTSSLTNKAELLTIFTEREFSPQNYLMAKAETAIALSKPTAKKKTSPKVSHQGNDIPNRSLFNRLAEWRREISEEQGVPAYTIFSNKALAGISDLLPETPEDLLSVFGIGKSKVFLYGGAVVGIVKEWLNENPGKNFRKGGRDERE